MHPAAGWGSHSLVRLGGGSINAGSSCCVATLPSDSLLQTSAFEQPIYRLLALFKVSLEGYGIGA
ncbi:MAG: hypothetical protein ACU84Q_06195 [Gammaproteobacteria bacterium]